MANSGNQVLGQIPAAPAVNGWTPLDAQTWAMDAADLPTHIAIEWMKERLIAAKYLEIALRE